MYACMYVCMYVCMYACMRVCMLYTHVCMYVCIYLCMYVCMPALGISRYLTIIYISQFPYSREFSSLLLLICFKVRSSNFNPSFSSISCSASIHWLSLGDSMWTVMLLKQWHSPLVSTAVWLKFVDTADSAKKSNVKWKSSIALRLQHFQVIFSK